MKLKFFVILLLSGTVCFAQDKVVFDYDKSGNMTSRQVVYLVIDKGVDYHWYRHIVVLYFELWKSLIQLALRLCSY